MVVVAPSFRLYKTALYPDSMDRSRYVRSLGSVNRIADAATPGALFPYWDNATRQIESSTYDLLERTKNTISSMSQRYEMVSEESMTIIPIRSRRDYERALRRIEALMDASQGPKRAMSWTYSRRLSRRTKRSITRFVLPTRSTRSHFGWINSA